MEATMNKLNTPTLEQRISGTLANPNSGSQELGEIVAETELAIVAAAETMTSERAKAADVLAAPRRERPRMPLPMRTRPS
jgi:hypothetical protein